MIYKCQYFHLVELLPEKFYNENIQKYKDNLWFLFDVRALMTLDRLRNRYGKTHINNWKWKKPGEKKDESRGLRLPDDPIGAKLSQHRFGRGFDPWFDRVTADEVREDLANHPEYPTFGYITAIEDGAIAKTWFHFDTRNWDRVRNGILIIKPMP